MTNKETYKIKKEQGLVVFFRPATGGLGVLRE